MSEDDVSRWLLGVSDAEDGADTLKDTRSLRAEETRTTMSRVTIGETSTIEDVSKVSPDEAASETEANAPNGDANAPAEEEGGSGVWRWLKRGKGAKGPPPKKKPGKLPPRTDQGPMKDSREAAADILREMQRRR
jgi:hypothetical protein